MGHSGRMPNWAFGAILVVLIAFGSVLAYTKRLPWTDRHEVSAVFESSQYLRPSNPVRIAGVNVGKVTSVEQIATPPSEEHAGPGDPSASAGGGQTAALVTMELNEDALPIHEDATFKIRPRLFLEGNYFIDLKSGSPSAPTVDEDHTFGLERTAYSVQIDEVLTTLQSDVRSHLQTLLDQFGNSLIHYKGADGLNELFRSAPVAYRYSAQVAESQLGTEPHDLRGLIRGLGRVLRGLGRDEQALGNLVTNLRTVTGSFAAEDRALGRTVELLPDFLEVGVPAFRALNRALPPLRAFAIEALPGVRRGPEALRASLPMLKQLRALMSRAELRGLVARLRPTVPLLAQLAKRNTKFFQQTRALSSCFNEVVIPWSHSTVEPVDPLGLYQEPIAGRTFEATAFGITGTAGESRSGDANGQHLRVLGAGGPNIVRYPAGLERDEVFGLTPFPIDGAIPQISDSAKTRFRPDVACETQDPPNLEAGVAEIPFEQTQLSASETGLSALEGRGGRRVREFAADLQNIEALADLSGRERRREIARLQRLVDLAGMTDIDVEAVVEAAG